MPVLLPPFPQPPLAVVIPALAEAPRLPALLADLAAAPAGLIRELLVVDGGSADATAAVARLGGARLLVSPPGRGLQLALGIAASDAPWLLLLHADGRLGGGWAAAVAAAIAATPPAALQANPAAAGAWWFDLAIDGPGPALRLVEAAVALRSRWRQLPYGDQGLLLPRALLAAAGGLVPLPLMEDLDLVLRLRRLTRLRSLGAGLRTDGRRWRRHGVLATTLANARLRRAWRRGVSAERLAERYRGR